MAIDGELGRLIGQAIRALEPELIEFRRDLHRHPEPSFGEYRTTEKIAERLAESGLHPVRLTGTGLYVDLDIGIDTGVVKPAISSASPPSVEQPSVEQSSVEDGSQSRVSKPRLSNGAHPATEAVHARLGIRADIDALPLPDTCGHPWESATPGWAHGCGHDVHATIALGTALALAELARQGIQIPPVRIIFQPAEEVVPGGAKAVLAQGVLTGVKEIVAVHCEPKLEVGTIGTRIGPITSATDEVTVTLTSSGGHTSRPHLTGDVVFALGEVITQTPGVLGRRLDPRSGVNLTWGMVQAGDAHNAIPATGKVAGTLRCLDVRAWETAGNMLDTAITQVVAPYAVDVTLQHVRGVPPVDNDAEVTSRLEKAAAAVVGANNVVLTEQSLGGEDFAWYLTKIPGSMARLGTNAPGARKQDLHQGSLDVDEAAIGIGVALFINYVLGH